MIYLFVTGKSSAYLDDIYTTLHLPSGMRHCYKYPCRNNRPTVSPDANERTCVSGETVLISFLDRDAQSNERLYIPIRYGELKNCELSEGQFYYDVILGEYCYTDDTEVFSKHILDIFQGETCHRDEEGVLKGVLVIRKDGLKDEFVEKNSEESWSKTVSLLADRSLFLNSYSIFTKLEIMDKAGKIVKPSMKEEYGYDLIIGKEYRIRLHYFIPSFNVDTMSSIPVWLEDSRDVCGILKKEYFMESRQGKIEFKLWPVKKSDMLLTSLTISVQCKLLNQKSVRYSRKAVDVRVRNRVGKGWKCVMQGACVAGVCATSFLTALPYRDIIEKTDALRNAQLPVTFLQDIIYDISCLLDRYSDVYSLICGIVMSISTFFLIKFTGKAKL